MKLNTEVCLRNSPLPEKKSAEIPGRHKTHGELNQVFVHLKIKVDMWIFFPPFSCVVIRHSVFFLKTVAFQPIWRSRDVFWNSIFSNYLEMTTKILFGFNLLSSFFSSGYFRVGFMCLPIHACCCSCQVMLVCPPLTSAPKHRELVLSSILSVCTVGDVYPKPHLLAGEPSSGVSGGSFRRLAVFTGEKVIVKKPNCMHEILQQLNKNPKVFNLTLENRSD